MQASSGRFAPTSSARTPTRVGFYVKLVIKSLVRKSICDYSIVLAYNSRHFTSVSQHRWWVRRPDNIGAQRLAEGGVPASGAGSAKGGLSHKTSQDLT